MAERAFYAAMLAACLIYLYHAFFIIAAPIQYDPLGPETWPRLLGVLLALTLILRLVAPSGVRPVLERLTGNRLAIVVLLMALYAIFFESAGFILSTWAFCTAVTALLGSPIWKATAFGGVVGIVAFFGFTDLLDLNLPGGLLEFLD